MELITDANAAADFINAILPPIDSIPAAPAQNNVVAIEDAKKSE